MKTRMGVLVAVSMAGILLAAGGCKIKKNEPSTKKAGDGVEIFFDNGGFNADEFIAKAWSEKIEPYFRDNAHDFAQVRAAIATDAQAAGKKYGHSENPVQTPWSFPVRLQGTVIDANTTSRAAFIAVDTDGDGKADAKVQLGPVIKGTSLRDVLPFIPFSAFKNQIEYANVGRALNKYVYEATLSKFPRDNLVGKQISAAGAFTLPAPGQEITITPAEITLAGGAQ
ncbi:DUF2291 domain-containing protein [Phyllobacterium salinisoli]|uniref:DUF2291 domain-containing protein n=1 Tax=Phyllobacterium salinisoli TaxID=1899321 RepID=A0A368K0R2_9HYPH|nr:DUF2291 domain-containing protein [Phyllobacterium salinisoli]RCS22977.1 DUF2291 domain-containing protein [Phyllobacterium salinisoli]